MGSFRSDRMKALRDQLGLSQSELARRAQSTQQTINRLEAGGTDNPRNILQLARALETSAAFLMGESDDASADGSLDLPAPIAPVDDRIIEIPVIDLAYGMGGTFLDDFDATVRSEPFPISFIRRYTKAQAENLVIADGLGDSMAPTIGSNDQMLIDRSVDTIRVADQIWAFSFGGVGMVKRLRPRPDGSVAILSDNPAVPEDRAVDGELFLIGRVVAIVRKV
jgi:phage repressor protein C with HTH and peptisase S24 domain